jgi:cysteinyl-tRNA synthetase
VRELNTAKSGGRTAEAGRLADSLRAMGRVMGLLQQAPAQYLKRGVGCAALADHEVDDLIAARRAARARKDFAESDRIRAALTAGGIVLEDKAGGATGWRRA